MASSKEKLNFQGLDTAAFTGKVGTAWNTYRKAVEAANKKIEPIMAPVIVDRQKLEETVEAQLIADGHMKRGQTAKFAYRFGGMAIAITDEATSKSSSKKLVLGSGR